MIEYTAEFEQLWQIYPKRNGNNPKRKAFNAYKARLKQNHYHDDMIEGLRRYRQYCEVSRTIGTAYIMHCSTFLGPDENFMEDWIPPEPERKNETIEDKGKRLNIVAKVGESMAEYERRLLQTR